MIVTEQIHDMSFHEKLYLMEALWDDLSRSDQNLDVPQWHKDLLDERENLLQKGEAHFLDWEDAKAQIKKATQ